MLKQKLAFKIFCLTALLFLGVLTGVLYTKHRIMQKEALQSNFHGTLLDEPRPVQSFTLMGIDGTPFSQNTLKNRWTMIFFGFTRCGFMCPTTMKELGKMYRMLEGNHVSPLPNVVMVSIDPARDNMDDLERYVHAFHPNFYGAKGSEEMTRAMTKALGIAYTKVANDPNAPARTDDIEHTGAIMLFNPNGQLTAFFTTPHNAGNIAEDYQLLLKNN